MISTWGGEWFSTGGVSGSVPGLVGVGDPDRVVGDVDHAGVFYFVNGVTSNIGHLSALGDQHNVVAL